MKQARRKRCKSCNDIFEPRSSFQVTCSPKCAYEYIKTKEGQSVIAEERRKENRKAKEALKPLSKLRQEAQTAFNAFIRERDKGKSCISCGRNHQGQWHAGHYRSVGAAPELRFEELNCHRQCMPCNAHKSGNLVEYRINLTKKIGLDAVEWLEGPHESKHYSREDLIQIKKTYRKKLRELQNES